MFVKCKKSPFTRAMLMEGSKFGEQFSKRVNQGTFLWNCFKIGPAISEENIFKELLKKFHFVTMATKVFDGIKFCEKFFKRTSQGTFLPSLVQVGPVAWEEKMFKEIVDEAWRTMQVILKAPLEHNSKKAFSIGPLGGMDWSLDCEHIFQVSSKYLQ